MYAFTDCEVSISPNCCVINEDKPNFMTVSDLLRISVENTKELLHKELLIQKGEAQEILHFASLEKIFIEKRIYKDKEFEESRSMDEAIAHVDKRLEPFKPSFIREVTSDDILKLMEIKMARILKFNSEKADELIAAKKEQIAQIDYDIDHLVDYTIKWYDSLKEKYGSRYPRLTEVRSFDTIEATKVVEANEKLYINKEEGFIGTSLKKDEFVCNCSDIDDIILFYRDGKYKVVKVSEKMFVGKNLLHIAVFKKNDKRTIYNAVYWDGKAGLHYMKRFAVTGVTRDKEYDLTQGKPGSRVVWFTANPNGEAEVLRVTFVPKPRMKTLFVDRDFSEIAIKGRQSMGNILTKNEIHRISLKERGGSTLGGRKVWFDRDVLRLNYDGRGEYLGEFHGDDQVLVVLENGEFCTTTSDATNHYDPNILRIEKFDPDKVWTVALYDAAQGYPYLKRFVFEAGSRKQSFLGDNPDSRLLLITDTSYPRIEVAFGEGDSFREPMVVNAAEFIAVKGFKAKGKRLTTYSVATINELEPLRQEDDSVVEDDSSVETDTFMDSNVDKPEDSASGQMTLF